MMMIILGSRAVVTLTKNKRIHEDNAMQKTAINNMKSMAL